MNGKRMKHAFMAAGVTLACSGQVSPQPDGQTAIRELVAREADVQISTWRPTVPATPAQAVTLRRLQADAPGFQVWEARVPTDHWHRYVVGQRGNELWLLAGFSTSDLPEFYNQLLAVGETPGADDQIGPYLVRLADPHGGERIVPGGATDVDSITQLWIAGRPSNWPADTSHVYPDGARLLRFTILSKQENSYDQSWMPAVYTFRFDSQRRLQAWYRREGTVLRSAPRASN